MSRPVDWSKTVTFFEDEWHEGNVPIMGRVPMRLGFARRYSMAPRIRRHRS